jgi:glycosyltransferase involved in cell wall biosynthesis
MAEPTLKICYIIGTYPGFSSTFIDREIRMMRQWGIPMQLLSIRPADPGRTLSAEQQANQREVIYLIPVQWGKFWRGHFYFLLKQPWIYLSTLFYLLTRRHPTLRDQAMTLLHFAEGVYAAYLLRSLGVNHLHAHFVDRAATVALVAARLLKIPYSLAVHAGEDIYVHPVLLREKFAEAKFVISCTQYNLDYLKQLGIPDLDRKAFAIHHGLDFEHYGTAPQPQTPPLLLSVGRLVEKKGLDYLIRACRQLQDQGREFVCHIIGSGPEREHLHALIQELGLQETVFLRGILPHDQVVDEYNRATLFALPCVQGQDGSLDGIPNVLPEAMASGVPVVSTPVSAIPELVVDGTNGLLVPPGEVTALAAALARLLDDPALRRQLGEQGRRAVKEQFDLNQNVRKVYEIFLRYGGPEHDAP